MSKKNGDTALAVVIQPWDQQAGESAPAFAAFRCYLEMGDKRSLRSVGRRLGKSATQIEKFSARWKWPERIKKYTKSLTDKIDREAQEAVARRLPDIMCEAEVLARVSMLARAEPLMVLDDNGDLDIKKLREAGLGYLLAGIETITTTYPNGTVVVRKKFKLEARAKLLEMLGRHHGLWTGEIDDPDELIARHLGVPKHLLPSTLEESGGRS